MTTPPVFDRAISVRCYRRAQSLRAIAAHHPPTKATLTAAIVYLEDYASQFPRQLGLPLGARSTLVAKGPARGPGRRAYSPTLETWGSGGTRWGPLSLSGREGHHHAKMTDDDIKDAHDWLYSGDYGPRRPAC